MNIRNLYRVLLSALAATASVGLGLTTTLAPLQAQETNPAPPSGKFIVHEWGTFTTFSGSNGVHLDFRPLKDQELPGFVFDRANQSGYLWFGKGRLKTRVRMETPVTYFYTDVERRIHVDVEFPRGLLTEFYPPVRSQYPPFDDKTATSEDGEPIGNGKLHWGEITLIPTAQLRPPVSDILTSQILGDHLATTIFPEAHGNHYDAARHTDSAIVHMRLESEATKTPTGQGPTGDFFEKFLFYRGVGKFEIPVSVTSEVPGVLNVTNHGREVLRRAIVYQLNGETITYEIVPNVAPGKSVTVRQSNRPVEMNTVAEILRQELVAAGLYEKEATAMINTWTSSWFMEQGTRLFYMVPQETTDRELPLHISPQPDEQLRVMVGRVEIMSASEEQRLIGIVKQAAEQRLTNLNQQLAQGVEHPVAPIIVPEEFRQLGRLAEPALHRLRDVSLDANVRNEAEAILAQLAVDRALEEVQSRDAGQVPNN
ncbi:MAG: hypothetical protein JNL67_05310 [Planctomycetaceae bacterium]|nr:hypothetical protein [Planctomycetaceae bacterium]